jgi:hypothetical protein
MWGESREARNFLDTLCAGDIDAGWRLEVVDVKPRSTSQGVLDIRTINQIPKENCRDVEEWLSKDGLKSKRNHCFVIYHFLWRRAATLY